MIELLFLGTAGYFPTPTRHTLGVLFPDLGILLDAGTGLFRLASLLQTRELDVFLSHAHLDHVCGLPFLLGIAHHCRLDRVAVHAEPSKIAAVQTHLFHPDLFPVVPPFQWNALSPDRTVSLAGDGTLRVFPLTHPGSSIGFRLDWPGRSMAYVTDTTADVSAEYVDQIRGVDLLLHECNFNSDQAEWAQKTGHSWTREVGKVAAEAQVGELIVFHVDPLSSADPPVRLGEIREHFDRVRLAEDLMVVRF